MRSGLRILYFFISLTVFGLPVFSQTTLPCTPPPAGLVAWWSGDGNAVEMQNGYNGSFQNGATFTNTANGKVREAFNLDGIDDFIQTPNNLNVDFGPNRNFTISAWIKFNSADITDSGGAIVSKHDNSNSAGYFLYVEQDGDIGFDISDGMPYYGLTGGNVGDGQWHFVVGQREGSTTRIFIDGVLSASRVASSGSLQNGDPLTFGDYFDGPGSFNFKGQIDEIAFFERALAPGEITALYNSGANGKCKPIKNQVLLVANSTANNVSKFDPETGEFIGELITSGSGGLNDPEGLAYDGVNTLYVTSYNTNQIKRYDIRTGAYLGDLNNGAGGLTTPTYLTIGPDGKLYVTTYASNRVLRYDLTTGAFESEFISEAAGGLSIAADLDFGPDSTGDGIGELYVVSRASNQIRRYNGASGAFIDVFTTSNNPLSLKFDTGGFLYVSSFNDNTVRRYFPNGTLDTGFNASGFDKYYGFEIDASGNILVSQANHSTGSNINRHGGTNGQLLNSFGSLPVNSLSLLLIPAFCTNAPAGQVAFYKADGSAEDSAGTNEGELKNGAFFTAGKAGSAAFSFDGVNDMVSVPASASINNQQFTIEGWINFAALSGSVRTIVSRLHDITMGAGSSHILRYDPNSQKLESVVEGAVRVQANFNPQTGTWYHVAQTFDGVTHRLFINGTEAASAVSPTAITFNDNPLTIGAVQNATGGFAGAMDEISIYNTAVSAANIATIYKTGKGGKCRPANACALPPVPMTSWFRAENDAADTANTSHGSIVNGAGFAAGKVGQAFSLDGTNDYVHIPHQDGLNTQSLTIDAWVNTDTLMGDVSQLRAIASKYDSRIGNLSWGLFMLNGGKLQFSVYQNDTVYRAVVTNNAVLTMGAWHHVAATFDGRTQELKIYINGVQVPAALDPGSWATVNIQRNTVPVRIGALAALSQNDITGYWDGLLDEVEIFSRALDASEIRSIYEADAAGKCLSPDLRLAVTPPVSPAANTPLTYTATVSNTGFGAASGAMLTAEIPPDAQFIGADPGCVFDSSSRIVFCQLGSIGANFAEKDNEKFAPEASVSKQITVQKATTGNLAITFKTIAGEADPVIADNFDASNINVLPLLAASVSVSGRVLSEDGRGLPGAVVVLTDQYGNQQTAGTNPFGYFHFEQVAVGQVFFHAFAKQYFFEPQVLTVTEDVSGLNFTALPER